MGGIYHVTSIIINCNIYNRSSSTYYKGATGHIKKLRRESRQERIASKKFIEVLIKSASEYKREAEDYREAYNECYAEYKALFRQSKEMKRHMEYIEDLHSHMVNNMHTLLKQGRVIKSKYMDKIIPYESFSSLSADDRYELFGA